MNRPLTRPEQRWIERWLEAGLTLLFPPRCAGCGQMGELWCSNCEQSIRKLRGRLCSQCGTPVRSQYHCRACVKHPLPIAVRSFGFYEGPLSQSLIHLKYRPNRKLASLMSEWLLEVFLHEGWVIDLVVPVPLGKKRLLHRGYNQAGMIAAAFAKILELPYSERALVRVRETLSQVGLDATARMRNVQGAFMGETEMVEDQRILVVDDLYTTGATLSACASALLESGAKEVYGLTVARARGNMPSKNL